MRWSNEFDCLVRLSVVSMGFEPLAAMTRPYTHNVIFLHFSENIENVFSGLGRALSASLSFWNVFPPNMAAIISSLLLVGSVSASTRPAMQGRYDLTMVHFVPVHARKLWLWLHRIVNGVPTTASEYPFIVDIRDANGTYSFCTGMPALTTFHTYPVNTHMSYSCCTDSMSSVQDRWCSWSGRLLFWRQVCVQYIYITCRVWQNACILPPVYFSTLPVVQYDGRTLVGCLSVAVCCSYHTVAPSILSSQDVVRTA